MRHEATVERTERFMDELGWRVRQPSNVYFTGGASAVLLGWRSTTADLDIKLIPDSDEILRAIPELKNRLQINIELAAPDQFIPALPEWESRSVSIRRVRKVQYWHYDFYSQALSKIERNFTKDLLDVQSMIESGHVEPGRLMELFESIEPDLFRYPSIDPETFRAGVEKICVP